MSGYEVVDLGDMVVTDATPVVSGPAGPAGPAFDPTPLLELIAELTARVAALEAGTPPVPVLPAPDPDVVGLYTVAAQAPDLTDPGLYAAAGLPEDPAAPGLYLIGA